MNQFLPQDPACFNESPAHSGAHIPESGLLGVRGRVGHDMRVLYAERVQSSKTRPDLSRTIGTSVCHRYMNTLYTVFRRHRSKTVWAMHRDPPPTCATQARSLHKKAVYIIAVLAEATRTH